MAKQPVGAKARTDSLGPLPMYDVSESDPVLREELYEAEAQLPQTGMPKPRVPSMLHHNGAVTVTREEPDMEA